MKHYIPMSQISSSEDEAAAFTGHDVIYREKGVSALDVQRAADTLLRLGRKPSIAALREQLGGGSPNTLGPLLEKYWKSLGNRIPAGPDALERVPDSLARLTEALWLRSIDEARERTKRSLIGTTPSQQTLAAMERRLTELTAALAESRARSSEMESQLLTSLRDRLELKEQIQQLTTLLKADQELRVQAEGRADALRREGQARGTEMLQLARRRIVTRPRRKAGSAPAKSAKQKAAVKPKKKATVSSIGKQRKKARQKARGLRPGQR
jgi:chromosome segregation ATPase